MLPIKINVPDSFLEEEERSGYVVTSAMKKVWAVELDLLEELKRVCRKHNITYFADSGTLMGAVRDKGYIPWDDDIDIVFLREDYDRLMQLAGEFEEPYFLQSFRTDDFPRGYARLRNTRTTALTRFDLGKDFNHGIFIDLFPLDHVPDDSSVKTDWLKRLRKTYKVLQYGHDRPFGRMASFVGNLKCLGAMIIYQLGGYKKHTLKFEAVCKEFLGTETKIVSYVAHSKGKEKHMWPIADFASHHEVPFEFTTICIPDGYDERLTIEYGDYMTPKKAPTQHGGMILDAETPYKDFLEQHSEAELKKTLKGSSLEES